VGRGDRQATRPRHVSAGRRFLVATVAGLAAGALAGEVLPWQAAILLGWDTAALVFAVWVLLSIFRKDAGDTAMHATEEDSSRAAADVMLLGASAASLAAVLLTLLKASSMAGASKTFLTLTAIGSVVVSWAVVHVIFTLRYARLYFTDPPGGIDWHEEGLRPSYRDFAYVAFTVGMTYQVSDTEINARAIRTAVLRHALLSYLFGTVIIAITINLIAGLAR
jgi:uncharacterized membrane protein